LEEFSFIDQVGKIMLFYTPSCGSTQDLVPLCARQAGGKHPAALLTFHQTQGRGQQNRPWKAEPGKNLAMSVWLPLKNPKPEFFPLLNMGLTVACIKALNQHPSNIQIKWPNDLRHNGAKLAGLLMEVQGDTQSGRALCMGIGVNANQTNFENLPQPATSLLNISGQTHNLMDLARSILNHLQTAFTAWEKKPDDDIFMQDYNNLTEGKNGLWEAETHNGQIITGEILGVDPQGRLLFHSDNRVQAFHHGMIRLKKKLSKK
jgi:BirA family biotin operon repressor/biotin-[acetyl-CoA-carboxylase] ligase